MKSLEEKRKAEAVKKANYRANKAGVVVTLTSEVSAGTKEQLVELSIKYGVKHRKMLETAIALFDFNGAEEARRLMAEHNGDDTAARAAYIAELAIEFPGQAHNKVGTLANKKFSRVNKAIGEEKKKGA